MKRILFKVVPAVLLLLCMFFAVSVSAEMANDSYLSDFSKDEDGWYSRGNAVISRTKNKTLSVTGRSDDYDSPCKQIDCASKAGYEVSVEIMQNTESSARFGITIDAIRGGQVAESWTIAGGDVSKGKWTRISTLNIAPSPNDSVVFGIRTKDCPTLDFEIRSFEVRWLGYRDYYDEHYTVYIEGLPYRQEYIGNIRPADFLSMDKADSKEGVFQCTNFTVNSTLSYTDEDERVLYYADVIAPKAGVYPSFLDDARLTTDMYDAKVVLPRMEVPAELIGTWEYKHKMHTEQYTFHDDNTVTCINYLNKNAWGHEDLRTCEYGYNGGFVDLGGDVFRFGLFTLEKGKLSYAGGDDNQRKERRTLKKVNKKRPVKSITLSEQSQFFDDEGTVLLADLGYRSKSEYRGLSIDMTFEPANPTDPNMIIHSSNPDVVEVLGYDYKRIYLRGRNEGTAEIYVEAADGSGVISNSIEIKVLKGESAVPEQLLGKAWKFEPDDKESIAKGEYLVFNENGICARYGLASYGGGMHCSFSHYRYLDGMIQLEDEHFQNLIMTETDDQITLRSKGNYKDIFRNGHEADGVTGTFRATELMTSDHTYHYDQNGIPWDEKHYHTDDPALWIPVEEDTIDPI